MTRTSRLPLTALAVSIALSTMGGTTLAAGPSASASPASASPASASPASGPATSAPFPDLTMAPLVTPPPIPPIVAPATSEQGIPVDGYALGDPAAPVTIEVYEDFQCPYCHLFTEQIEPQIIDTYVRPGIARLVFRDLPFLGEESRWAAVAARLASQQGLFWPMHDYLFANQLGENAGSFTPDRLMAMAQAAGLDMDTFIAGLQVPAARALYAQVEAEAYQRASALGIKATPTVVVNGVPTASVDLASVSAAIEAALAGSASASPGPVAPLPSSGSPAPSAP
jgi:protein-disulfide isomerase